MSEHSQRVDCRLSMCGDLVLTGASRADRAGVAHLLAIFVCYYPRLHP